MKMLQLKSKFYKILLIVYSVLSIASTVYLLLRPGENTDVRYRETQQELRHIRKYLKQKDVRYEQTMDSLKKRSDSLQNVIRSTEKRLRYSRSQVNSLSNKLNNYVQQFKIDTSLKKNDTAFDSLSVMSRDFILVSRARDSLCDEENNSLKELVSVKDSIISKSDSLLRDYKSSVEQLLRTSDELNQQLLQSEKKLKRKSRFNKVVSVACVFLSGFLISKL